MLALMASADTPPGASLDGLDMSATSGLADQHHDNVRESPGKGVVVVR
jgi:hypothetical protein